MTRDTVVSWRKFALFLLVPPVAVIALVAFPVTLVVVYLLYRRGRFQSIGR